RYYVPAGNNLVVYNRWSTGSNPIYYITQDHLGSSAAVTDQSGALVMTEKFSALGWRTAGAASTIDSITHRGFTGNETLDNYGLWMVHMNGRLYIPSGSWFISPDPFIQDPSDTQSYNRYSYVHYNPLTYTDPSGYFTQCIDTGFTLSYTAIYSDGTQ